MELKGEINRLQGSRSAPIETVMVRQVFRKINVVSGPLAGSLFEAGAHLVRPTHAGRVGFSRYGDFIGTGERMLGE